MDYLCYFLNDAKSIGLRVCDLNFRNTLVSWGIPYGKKSRIIEAPLHLKWLSIPDYVRGLIDGDGSVCFSRFHRPIVSFTTQSENIKEFITIFTKDICGNDKHHFTKPKRDDCLNISITNIDAVKIAKVLYYKNCLSINRKYKTAQKIKKWTTKEFSVQKMSKDDLKFILNNSILVCCAKFKKSHGTISSIRNKIKNGKEVRYNNNPNAFKI